MSEPLDTQLTNFTDDVWLATAPVRHLGMHLSATMTVLRLADGSLLVISPIEPTPQCRAAVEALGPIAHLYAPNLYHHLHIGEWAAAHPHTRLHAPGGLAGKRPDLRIDRVHAGAASRTPEPAFADVVDELTIEGFRLQETVLLHRPSRTLIVADLVHAVGRPQHGWTAFYARAMGFYDRVALSRMIRWIGFDDRRAARRSLDALLQLPFDRMIVGHGTPLQSGAPQAIAAAYAWLR